MPRYVTALLLVLASAAVGQETVVSIPAAEGRPELALPAGVKAADLTLPEWLATGTRISWHGGDAILSGVRTKLVPSKDGKGYWTDPKTGKQYNEESTRSSGGVGYHQANIVAASARFLAVDARNFPITDVANNVAGSGGALAVAGDAASLGVYWIHPKLLAVLGGDGGATLPANVTLVRGPYGFHGRDIQAITITSESASGHSRTVYDLESGILMFRGSSAAGEAVSTIDEHGRVSPGGGDTAISHLLLVSVRKLEIPWSGDAAPAWAAKGAQLRYAGTTAAVTNMGPLPGQGVSSSITLGEVAGGVAQGRLVTMYDIGPGLPPQQSVEDRFFASGMFYPLWIAPASLAKLQTGQVLDQDPVTRFVTRFEGVQGAVASILVQGPAEATQYFYDRNSGAMAAMRTVKQTVTGQMRTELAAVR